jgi:hypothetical protein
MSPGYINGTLGGLAVFVSVELNNLIQVDELQDSVTLGKRER